MNKIEIPLSKTKIIFMVLGSIVFVVGGLWIFLYVADQQTRREPLFLKIIGAATVLFFGSTGVFGLVKLFDDKAGLIIDENGITDNSSGVSVGLIEWQDITGIRSGQMMTTKFLLIDTSQPEKYIERAGGVKGKVMKSNVKMVGTPLSIASTALKCNFDELEKLVETKFVEFKK